MVETVQQNGSVKGAADYLELPVEKVLACMRYYADSHGSLARTSAGIASR